MVPTRLKLSDVVAQSSAQPSASSDQAGVLDTVAGYGRGAVRGAGLATRSLIEGAGAIPIALTDAAGRMVIGDEYQPVSETLSSAGLPEPETPGEQLGSAIGRGGASVVNGFGAGQLLQQSTNSVARGVGDILRAAPGAQTVAGASGGASAEVARQAGVGPDGQLVASVVGGLGGGLAARSIDAPAAYGSLSAGSRQNVPLTDTPDLPPGAATNAADADALRQAAAQAETVAKSGAEKIGLNWDALDDNLKSQMRQVASDATGMKSDLPPEAIARAAVYESVGIKPTRALITRDFADALSEQNLLTENEGQALRNIYAQNNQAIREQITKLAPEGVKATDSPTFGEQFRSPLVEGEQRTQRVTNRAYQTAQNVEGSRPAATDRLNEFLHDNAGTLNNRPSSSGLIDDLQKMGLMRQEVRNAEMVGQTKEFTLKDLASARAAVNEAWTTAKSTGDIRAVSRLNEMRRIMDDIETDAGGELYNAYRKLRIKKGGMYENNPLIDKLISDQNGYIGTSKIEDSQVFDKAVLGSTSEQFSKVWPRLTPKAKDLTRAQVAKYIEEKTFSGMATNEQGDVVASATKLNRTLESINPQKLELIYGKEKSEALDRLSTAVREISNPPRGTAPQGSAPKLVFRMNMLMKGLGMVTRIPYAGDLAKAAGAAVEKGAKIRANEAAARAAINPIPKAPVAPPPRMAIPSSIQYAPAALMGDETNR